MPNDIERALILREFRRQSFILPITSGDEAVQSLGKAKVAGRRDRMRAQLKRAA